MKKAIRVLATISLVMTIVTIISSFIWGILCFASSATVVSIIIQALESEGVDTSGMGEAIALYVLYFGIIAIVLVIEGILGIVFNAIILGLAKKEVTPKAAYIAWGILSFIFATHVIQNVLGVLMIIEGAKNGK